MLKRAVSRYIDLGGSFGFLMFTSAGVPIHGDGFIANNIDRFLSRLPHFSLKVTDRACWRLKQFREKLEKRPKDAKLTTEEANELQKLMTEIRATLFAEADGNIAYIATDKRFAAEKLSDDPWSLFGDRVKLVLPEIAIYDFEEAAKCLLFERSTATAFHLMRGTEAVLRAYAAQKTGKPAVEMWGALVASLRKLAPAVPASLTDHLDHIRRNFRNPTQHPEKIYDLNEVQDLFGICIDVVNRMAKDLPEPTLAA